MNEAEARKHVEHIDAIWKLEGAEPDEDLSQMRIRRLTGDISEEELVQYVRGKLAKRGIDWNPATD